MIRIAASGGGVARRTILPQLPLGVPERTYHIMPSALMALLVCAVATACGSTDLTMVEVGGQEDTASLYDARIQVVSGNGQQGEVGSPLGSALVVEVTDSTGAPLAGAPIGWTFTQGVGSSAGSDESSNVVETATDVAGRVEVFWQLGVEAGIQTATAEIRLPTEGPGTTQGPMLAPNNDNGRKVGLNARAKPGRAETIQVSPDSVTVLETDSLQLTARVSDRYGNLLDSASVQWSSSNEAIAQTTETGVVRGVAAGTASITATSGSAEGSAMVTVDALPVVNQAPTATITSPAGNLTVTLGEAVHFQGEASDSDGTIAAHSWTFGDGGDSALEDPGFYTFGSEGSYRVTYQVIDDEGAPSQVTTRTVTVVVAEPVGQVVIFEDGFETGDLSRWDMFDANKYSVTSEAGRVRSGGFALQARTGEFGELNKWFMPGYSDVHVEFDVMFQEGFQNLRSDGWGMHFFAVLGNRVDDRWSAHGKAGIQPDGTDFFVTVVDPEQWYGDPTLRPFTFYTNYPDMSCGRVCYGNTFQQASPPTDLIPGQWYHIEIRVKANTPGETDGVQELWIDGVKKIEVTGMRWRDTDEVRVNEASVWNYMPGSPDQSLWLDNVVIWHPE